MTRQDNRTNNRKIRMNGQGFFCPLTVRPDMTNRAFDGYAVPA